MIVIQKELGDHLVAQDNDAKENIPTLKIIMKENLEELKEMNRLADLDIMDWLEMFKLKFELLVGYHKP
jgi:hypothetical protein